MSARRNLSVIQFPTHDLMDMEGHLTDKVHETTDEHLTNPDHRYMRDLTEHISVHGIQTPLEVTEMHGQPPYLSAGSHRALAASRLGLSHVPVIWHKSSIWHKNDESENARIKDAGDQSYWRGSKDWRS